MLAGHNRMNAAQIAGMTDIPAIVKTDLTDEEAYVYVIETNVIQRSFTDLAPSEKAAVLSARYEKVISQGKRNDILREIEEIGTCGHDVHKSKSRDGIGEEYGMTGRNIARYMRVDKLIRPFKDRLDAGDLTLTAAVELSYLSEEEQEAVAARDVKVDLKNAGLMVGDAFTMQYAAVTDSVSDHADRQYNTGKISSVAVDNDTHEITITLSDKVNNLKDFDGGNGWGVHKWLGIGLGVGISPITGLYYNGSTLGDEDVAEATACDLSAGYFVRWVAADLVLAGDNTEKSVDNFTLWADGYTETAYKIKIVEPA